jgi:hypothetical protein
MPSRKYHIDVSVLSHHFNRIPSVMYHGTSSKHYESLLDYPSVNRSTGLKDFGCGFYLTSNFNAASKHADDVTFDDDPIVFEYVVDVPKLKTFQGKVFPYMNLNWAEFIYYNRSYTNFQQHYFDWVYGGVADSQFRYLIPLVDNGNMTIGNFYEKIAKYKFNQLAINNQEIIDTGIIKLVKVVNSHEQTAYQHSTI